jgi:hypothetical protein
MARRLMWFCGGVTVGVLIADLDLSRYLEAALVLACWAVCVLWPAEAIESSPVH